MKKILSLLLILTMIFTLAACGNDSDDQTSTDAPATDAAADTADDAAADTADDAAVLVGEVTVSGSTSVEKIGVATGDEFMALNPGITFTYEGIGSSGGVKNANERITNIGAASRNLKDSEKEYGLTEVVVAYDGIAVIVNPENEAITGLSMEQVKAIYTGEITNWSEVGGADQAISVVSREDGSGTRGAFEELVDFEDALSATAVLKDGNGNVQATVAENPNAIGYVSFTYLDETVKGIEVNGTLPTVDNVLNGSFPISRPFLMMYHEDNMTDASAAYIDFILSTEGQDIVEAKGGIRVDAAPAAETAEESVEETVLIGEVTVSGSTSVEKIGIATGDEFMALNPGVTFTYEGIGSSGGVKNANEKITNIGAASRNLKDSEKDYGMTEVVIAYDGIAVIVNPANEAINGLSMEEVKAIYTGEITNWSEVGGADQAISVVSREDGSGTRGAFEELVDFEDALTATAVLKDGNGNVQATVAENPNAIGYVSFTYLDETVKGIEVDGALPTVDNVLSGSFPISRPFIMMYHEDNMNDVAKAYIDFILSDAGQTIVEAKGGIKVK